MHIGISRARQHRMPVTKPVFILPVIFQSLSWNQRIISLKCFRESQALLNLCPESIVQVRYNRRFDVTVVETRSDQTSGILLPCTALCGLRGRKSTKPYHVHVRLV